MSSSLVLGDGLNHVRHFVDTIGKRITGSEGERRAAEYQCQRLQAWGCEDVRCEPFAARGWDFDVCRVNCDELGTVEALPIEFSASTPAGGTGGLREGGRRGGGADRRQDRPVLRWPSGG